MQASITTPRVKNILIRHSCSKDVLPSTTYKNPENFHLLKYFPKYYNSLTLELTKEKSLRSKLKRAKKLKRFTGFYKKNPPSRLWVNLLGNTRKEIEELPRIISKNAYGNSYRPFWRKLNLWKIKFFPNITRVFLPKRKPDNVVQEYDDFSSVKKSFMKYFRGLKKVKTLEIFAPERNHKEMKWMLEKIDRMDLFLERLETKRIYLEYSSVNIQELSKDKILASQLTSLIFSFNLIGFDEDLIMLPQICKTLKFLSIGFIRPMDGKPEFIKLLTSLRNLPHLLGLEFGLPRGAKYYWEYFKPQSSLRYLKLKLDGSDLISGDLIGAKAKDTFGHWEDFEHLDELEFIIQAVHILEVAHVRSFFTSMLQKVRKLRSLKATIETYAPGRNSPRGEPFVVEEISHLYDCLEKFEFTFKNLSGGEHPKFDMKTMRVFRNLKEFKFHGILIDAENIEEMVDLLQTNYKEGDLPMFTFVSEYLQSFSWLRETLEKISLTKKVGKNLRIAMELGFQTNPNDFTEALLDILKSVGVIKGLFISLKFGTSYQIMNMDKFRNLVKKYGELRNLVIKMGTSWTYRRLDGEKEQFIF